MCSTITGQDRVLCCVQDSIKASQGWFMACAPYAAGMAYMMASRASTTPEFDKLLHLIYLANDILFKAFTQQQQQAQAAQQEDGQQQQQTEAAKMWASIAAAFAPALGVMLAAAQAAAASSGNGAGRDKLSKMLAFWQVCICHDIWRAFGCGSLLYRLLALWLVHAGYPCVLCADCPLWLRWGLTSGNLVGTPL